MFEAKFSTEQVQKAMRCQNVKLPGWDNISTSKNVTPNSLQY